MEKVSRAFTMSGGAVMLIVGIGMISVTIYAFTRAAITFYDYRLLCILLGADIITLISAIMGIVGAKRRSKTLISVFQGFLIIFFVVYLGIGITAEVLPTAMFKGNCTDS
jgi:hypothetical protein